MNIRFRTWDSEKEKMYYPDRVLNFNENNYCIEVDGDSFIIDGDGERHYKSGLIQMQEIQVYKSKMYIGDIVDVTIDGYLDIGGTSFDTEEPKVFRGTIVYSNDYYAFGVKFNEGEFMYLSTIDCDEVEDIVVVGNICEDPNLIKENK